MSLIIPNVGKKNFNKLFSGETAAHTLFLKLFQNNYTPVATTDVGDFTEASFSGYVTKTLSNPVTQAALDANNRAVTLYDLVTWTKSGATGNSIYGYYVLDNGGGLVWCERFVTGAWSMTVDGTILQFYPTFTNRSQFSNS